jgi:hypothetical protein
VLFPFVEDNQCSDYSRNPSAKRKKENDEKTTAAFINNGKRGKKDGKKYSE